MSVSVAAIQLRVLVVAVVVAAFGRLIVVSIDEGRAANGTFVAESSAGEFTPASGDTAQPPVGSQTSAQALNPRHRLAFPYSNAPTHDPPSAVPARARPAVAPSASSVEDQDLSRPRKVNPIRVQVPVAASTVLADNEFATGALFAGRRGPDDVLAMMATLADIYDDTRMSPMWPDSLPSPASLTPAELVRLLGICGGVALCIYGLLAFNLRRRSDRRPTGRSRAHAPPPFA
jgi:hypothetical protein